MNKILHLGLGSMLRNVKPITKQPDISAMLPIWSDESKSPATTKHLLGLLIHRTGYLNPGQAFIIGLYLPFHSIAKILQWYNPDLHGPAKLVPMLGALHKRWSCLAAWVMVVGQ